MSVQECLSLSLYQNQIVGSPLHGYTWMKLPASRGLQQSWRTANCIYASTAVLNFPFLYSLSPHPSCNVSIVGSCQAPAQLCLYCSQVEGGAGKGIRCVGTAGSHMVMTQLPDSKEPSGLKLGGVFRNKWQLHRCTQRSCFRAMPSSCACEYFVRLGSLILSIECLTPIDYQLCLVLQMLWSVQYCLTLSSIACLHSLEIPVWVKWVSLSGFRLIKGIEIMVLQQFSVWIWFKGSFAPWVEHSHLDFKNCRTSCLASHLNR